MYFKLIDIINSISCFQLAFFIFYLIHKGWKNISNQILATFFLAQIIVILSFLLGDFYQFGSSFHLKIAYIYFPFEFLWGPLLFFYVKSQLKKDFKLKKTDAIHIIPFILVTIFILIFYYFQDMETKHNIINNGLIYRWFNYFNIPYFLLLFSYNFISIYLILKFQNDQKNYFSFTANPKIDWLKKVMYGYLIACIFTAITVIIQQFITIPLHVLLIVLFVPYFILFNFLFYIAITNSVVIIMPDEKHTGIASTLQEKDIYDYAKSIETHLLSKKIYLNHTLTLHDLAEDIGIGERIISYVINSYWNHNFYSFINKYRVEEAKILLDNFDQHKSNMLGISLDAGFNSKSAFYDAFKKYTGMTPTEYRKTKMS